MGMGRHNLTGDTGTHIMLGYIVIAGTILLASAEDVTVMLNKGKLKGERMDYDFGQYYYAFKGIPYAKPPVKELRFMPPQEVDPWTEMLDATEDGSLCPQYDISQSLPIGDENCLSLNVYSPKLDSKKRAVMVYFHGGAYIMGGGASFFFGPGYLLEQNVVLVTFNYRLGPLGFLSTTDKAAGGNQGVQDQIMVLKWVKENIAKFGGDPNKVTIFGRPPVHLQRYLGGRAADVALRHKVHQKYFHPTPHQLCKDKRAHPRNDRPHQH